MMGTCLDTWEISDDDRDALVLVVSELVTNAVSQGRSSIDPVPKTTSCPASRAADANGIKREEVTRMPGGTRTGFAPHEHSDQPFTTGSASRRF
jgi:hypothetical protein